MRWDSTPFKNSKDMKTLGGLFNNNGNMPIPLKIKTKDKNFEFISKFSKW
jgi:hypothetical protein